MVLLPIDPIPPDPGAAEPAAGAGSAWERPAGALGRAAAAPFAVLGSDGAFLVVWEHHGEGEPDVMVCRREPGPRGEWGEPLRLDTDPPGSARSLEPRLAVGPRGRVIAAWQDARGGRTHIRANRSTDGGVTWLAADVAVSAESPGPATLPSVAFDSAGAAWVAWEDGRDGARDIRLARSPDGGTTWEPDLRVDSDPPGTAASWHPQIVALPDTTLLVVWWDERDGLADLYVRRPVPGHGGPAPPEVRLDPGGAGATRSHGAHPARHGPEVSIRWQEGDGPESPWLTRTSSDSGRSWGPVRPGPPVPAHGLDPLPVVTAGGDTLIVRCVEGPDGPELAARWQPASGRPEGSGVSGRGSDRPGE